MTHNKRVINLFVNEFILEHFIVQDVDIKTDPHTGESRGFGFLLYKDEASIDEVVNNGPHNLGMRFENPTRVVHLKNQKFS